MKSARPLLATGGQVAEHEDERDPEDADRERVDEHERLEPPEPVDVLGAAARVRPGRGRERAAEEQHEAGPRGEDPQAAELKRHDRLGPAGARAVGLEREHDGSGQDDHRKQ